MSSERILPPLDRSHVASVTTREELIFLLSRAAELEHGLACIYLFAAYSLKNDVAEGGITEAQVELVRGWKRSLASVGVEEMLHLAQVTNMLTAIGGAPHFRRSNFPMPATAFPFGLRLTLEPFSQETIERFVCYEMPESGVLSTEQEAIYAPMRARIVAGEGGGSDDIGEGGAPLRLDAVESGTSREPFEIALRRSASSITKSRRVSMRFRKRNSSSVHPKLRRTRASSILTANSSPSLTGLRRAPPST